MVETVSNVAEIPHQVTESLQDALSCNNLVVAPLSGDLMLKTAPSKLKGIKFPLE